MAIGGGTYQQRPDGLYDVSPVPGMPPIPLALSDADLQSAGLTPVPAPPPVATGLQALAGPYMMGANPISTAPNLEVVEKEETERRAAGMPRSIPQTDLTYMQQLGEAYNKGTITAEQLEAGYRGETEAGKKALAQEQVKGFNPPPASLAPATLAGKGKVSPEDLIPVGGATAGGVAVPAGGRAIKIPAKDVRASFTRVPGVEIDPELRSAIDTDTAPAHLVASAEEQRTKQLEALTNERGALNREIQALDQQEVKRAEVNAKIARQEKLIEQRDKEAEKLRPQSAKEVWENRGAFAQMMGAVSVILGGYLQGMQGSHRNPALDMLNESIDREVADQRRTWEDSRDAKEEARNDFARAIAIYGTPEAAELDLRMRRLAIAENMLRSEIQEAGAEGQYHAALAEADNMRLQRGMLRQQLSEMEKGRITQENFVHVPERIVGGGAAKPKAIDRMVVLPNGQRAWARTTKSAQDSQARLNDNVGLLQEIDHIKALRQGNRADPAVRGKIKTAAGRLFLQIKDASNLGTLDKGALDFREEYIGNPEALLELSADEKLEELTVGARRKIQQTLQSELHGDPDAVSPLVNPAPASTRSDE